MTRFQEIVLVAVVGRTSRQADEPLQEWLDRVTLEASRLVDAACRRFGHNWTPWWVADQQNQDFESRWCDNCHRLEQRRKVSP